MAIEQFVKHVEGLQNHYIKAQAKTNNQSVKVQHLGNDLVKLKDMLKQAMQQQNAQYR